MRRPPFSLLPAALLLAACPGGLMTACAGSPERRTLAELHRVEPELSELRVDDGLERAMHAYERFLAEAPESALTPEAMRRLADLKLEKQYGILGDGEIVEMPAPDAAPAPAKPSTAPAKRAPSDRPPAAGVADHSESIGDFERRAAAEDRIAQADEAGAVALPAGEEVPWKGPLEAIALYDRILAKYPDYEHADQILYQKARAYDELGRNDEAVAVIDRLVAEYPHSRYLDEVQFRRAEYFFVRRKYLDAEEGYAAVVRMGPVSEYYELALYKLGWALYKQEMHEEALHRYVALLDHKVAAGYDFDQSTDESDERRIADTFRVVSLSFSSLGGADAVRAYFEVHGSRPYEDRVYSHLGEFYLEKLRYEDAASAYRAFVTLHPLHRAAPHFGMRVVEVYEAGGFPRLVLESKKEFAASYGLRSAYWTHFDVKDAPEVLAYLKSNLEDLAGHYHALYQEDEQVEQRPAHFDEALRWYRAYLTSFPDDADTPAVHYRLADLLLEHEDFGEAAREYERTAYAYPPHEQAGAAGYAAIFAHREHQSRSEGAAQAEARREAVRSTLQFVDAFPEHEHAPVVLGAAVDDLYEMEAFERAIATGHRLVESYPESEPAIRRAAWTAIAHASFDLEAFEDAERAYGRVLEMTPAADESRQATVDNLAAAIYKQGEQASAAEDHRLAADHFLRIREAAPSSDIRAAAEYDAGAALMRLEDWDRAAAVLDEFRQSHPEHELQEEATKRIALIHREEGDLAAAAREYERVAAEADDEELQRESLLLAGELYEQAEVPDRALAAYRGYVAQFPEPLELAVETRFKIATLYDAAGDRQTYHAELERIVRLDADAGAERTARVRFLAARSALVLARPAFERFQQVRLVQPFERSLQQKQQRMDAALRELEDLVDYEVGEVTAAATFYIAQVYLDFSRALMESERPADLGPAELEQYEVVLEGEAFPFEEQAIAVHEKNLELMAAGVYNDWIARSLAELAALVPGRYAKFEASSGPIAALDRYAYRLPGAAPAEGGGAAAPAPPEPAPAS